MEISEKEKRAIETYRGNGYRLINNILEVDMSAEADFIIHSTDKPKTFDRSDIERMMENVKLIYSVMIKYSKANGKPPKRVFRGTAVSDMERLQERGVANKFLSTTLDVETQAKGYFSLNFSRPAFVGIDVPEDVPYLYMGDVLELGQNPEKEYLLSPFLKISEFEYIKSETRSTVSGPKTQKSYRMKVERQELTELPEEERVSLTTSVLDNAEDISKKQERYFKVLEEILDCEWKIKRNKEQIYDIRNTLYRGDISEKERKWLEDDFSFLSLENSKTLEDEHSRLLQEKDALAQEVEAWKRNVARVCMSECRTVEKNIEQQIEEERIAQEQRAIQKQIEREQKANQERINNKRAESNRIMQLHEMACNMVGTKANNIDRSAKELIAFKETLASIAKGMGISYTSRLDVIHHLPQCIKGLNDRLETFSSLGEGPTPDTAEELEALISSQQGVKEASSRLLRECDALKNIKVDELKAIEEKSFKGEIANSVLDVKLDVFTSILRDEISNIGGEKGIKRLFHKITGRAKKAEQRKVELNNAISVIQNKRRGIRDNRDLNVRYSIHEIMADILDIKGMCGISQEFEKKITYLMEQDEKAPELRQKFDSLKKKYGINITWEAFRKLRNIEMGINKTYRVEKDRVNMIIAKNNQNKMPAVKGKEYSISDLILFQVKDFNKPITNNSGNARRDFDFAPEYPSALADCMDLESSIQIMSNIMRDAIGGRERSKQVNIER